jgi:hypothetical protein
MTARPTLVFIQHHEIDGRIFTHASELEPGLLSPEQVNKLIDRGVLKEYDSSERRSLYRLLHHFSSCSETERLSTEELAAALTS